MIFLPLQWILNMGSQNLWKIAGQNGHQRVRINILIMNAFPLKVIKELEATTKTPSASLQNNIYRSGFVTLCASKQIAVIPSGKHRT
jgi:hypothetical protein